MYTIDKIEELRGEKQKVLFRVYHQGSDLDSDLDRVYEKQRELRSMSISIFTDVADVILPVLKDDGVGKVVWSHISLRLDKLSFVSVPTEAKIQEKYQKSVDKPTAIQSNDIIPDFGTKTKVKKNHIRDWAAKGRDELIKIKDEFDEFVEKLQKREKITQLKAEPTHTVDYDGMYKDAIKKTYEKNCEKLNDWFERLEKITAEEIEKSVKANGGMI